MNEIILKTGTILKIDDDLYRIIYVSSPWIVLCQMNTDKFILGEYDLRSIRAGIMKNDITLTDEKKRNVVDLDKLDETEKRNYLFRKGVIDEVNKAYAPSYLGLSGKQYKADVERIIRSHGLTRPRFWRICRAYLQSGMREASLLRKPPSTLSDPLKGRKRGPKGEHGITTGCRLTEEVIEAFEYGLAFYKSGRAKSYTAAYNYMNNAYFFHDVIIGGVKQNRLLPLDQRPTLRQFYYYCSKHLSAEERDEVKTSKMEVRNNLRLLLSESSINVESAGEKVEVDSLDVDLSLISIVSGATRQSVGRASVYAMRDVLTHAVVAFSVNLEQNSVVGFTNLLLNLGDDKREFCKRYGWEDVDLSLFPSNFIPAEMYTDRGSDYKSDPVQRICNELGITRHIVPGGSGSMKGLIEQWFHQVHSMINPYTEGAGQIQKRHDSKHHKQAVLTVEDFTKMLLTCVIAYNGKHMDNYKQRVCELEDGVNAAPADLWQYYCTKKGAPKPITDQTDYLYKLLVPYQAKLDKRGIHCHRLTYINLDDDDLLRQMYRAQNKKQKMNVRFDPRDNSRIYYIDLAGDLVSAELNDGIEWQTDLKGLTFSETKDYFKMLSLKKKEQQQRNQEIDAVRDRVVDDTVEKAKAEAEGLAETKNIRDMREQERQLINRENAITERIETQKQKRIGSAPAVPAVTYRNEAAETKTGGVDILTDEEYLDMVSHFYDADIEE